MPGRRSFLLLASIVLISIIAAEYGLTRHHPQAIAMRRSPVAELAKPDQSEVWTRRILARPLFSPDRRPPAQALETSNGLPRLTGIIVMQADKRAIFAGTNGKAIALAEGAQIGPYQIASIQPGLVIVSGPEGQRVLRAAFDHDASPQHPAIQPSSPPTSPAVSATSPALLTLPPLPPRDMPAGPLPAVSPLQGSSP